MPIRPHRIARWGEVDGGIMITSEHLRRGDQRLVRLPDRGQNAGLAIDEGQDLAVLLVDPQKTRTAVESPVLQMQQ
ncbi:MAG: hypothetical protein R2856_03625 [Caldilineaceae bacterium]